MANWIGCVTFPMNPPGSSSEGSDGLSKRCKCCRWSVGWLVVGWPDIFSYKGREVTFLSLLSEHLFNCASCEGATRRPSSPCLGSAPLSSESWSGSSESPGSSPTVSRMKRSVKHWTLEQVWRSEPAFPGRFLFILNFCTQNRKKFFNQKQFFWGMYWNS